MNLYRHWKNGIVYPIVLEVVSHLDEKYSSLVVLDLFGKETEKKITISLIASLGILLLYVLKLLPPESGKSLGINLWGSANMIEFFY